MANSTSIWTTTDLEARINKNLRIYSKGIQIQRARSIPRKVIEPLLKCKEKVGELKNVNVGLEICGGPTPPVK